MDCAMLISVTAPCEVWFCHVCIPLKMVRDCQVFVPMTCAAVQLHCNVVLATGAPSCSL